MKNKVAIIILSCFIVAGVGTSLYWNHVKAEYPNAGYVFAIICAVLLLVVILVKPKGDKSTQ